MLKSLGNALRWFAFIPISMAKSLVTPIHMKVVNRKLLKQDLSKEPFQELSDDQLDGLVQSEWQRAKEIDDKLYKLTAALSIAVAIAGLAGTTLLQTLSHSNMKYPIAIIFLLASLQFIVGVYIGFSGAIPKPRYGYGAGYLSKIASGNDSAHLERVSAASAFQRDNLIRSNEATAATISIRNGILTLSFALLASLLTAMIDLPESGADEEEGKIILVFVIDQKEVSLIRNWITAV
jgi:hypothetical protein